MTLLLQKGIFAVGDFVTPLKAELATIGFYAGAAVGLSHVCSVTGLALARAGDYVATMLVTYCLVRHTWVCRSPPRLLSFALRPLLAAGVAVAVYYAAFLVVDRAHSSPSYLLTAAEQITLLLASGGVYVVVASLLGIEEVRVLWRAVPSVQSRRAVTQEAA